jgi:hypothetical protein
MQPGCFHTDCPPFDTLFLALYNLSVQTFFTDRGMTTREDWQAACDAVVDELLAAAEILAPPVDVLAITARLAWPVVWDTGQTGRARFQRLDGRPTLFVRPEERPERLQWAVAHEIGEASAWQVCERVGVSPDELAPRQREELANQFAQRLLLPTGWFDSCRDDLFALKARFTTASHELIAWRWLDRAEPTVVSLFDQGRLVRRRCNFADRAPALCSAETACVEAARRSGATEQGQWEGGRVRGWPVHETGWQREILRTDLEWT